MITCKHYRIIGHVQGVWYRGSTRDQARRLGLLGWVRNCDDGTVEALACGDSAALGDFESWLKHGPSAARVDRVEAADAERCSQPDDFVIRP